MAITWDDLITEFLIETYGSEMRKGVNKFAYEHSRDVICYCFLETVDDPERVALLRKLALLHNVVDDKCDLETIVSRFVLDREESDLLALLSRNVENPQGLEYWPGVASSEDALIIKLADQMANVVDLITWIKESDGVSAEALKICQKYLDEFDELESLFTAEILELTQNDHHPFCYQIPTLKALIDIVRAFYLFHQVLGKSLPVEDRSDLLGSFAELFDTLKYKHRFKPMVAGASALTEMAK